MNEREQRGLIIAALCKLKLDRDSGNWFVPSQSCEKHYTVNVQSGTCTCPDHTDGGFKCKHLYACEVVQRREIMPDGTITETKSITFTEKKVYRQNWPAYNAAQVNEKAKFQVLLADLCRGLPLPPPKEGRPPLSIRDVVFATAFKVYSTVSTRRFMTDLNESHAKGYISKAPHYNSICREFEKESLTPILQSLIVESAKPLKALEDSFAVDSSGFSTSRFVRWYDEKYGVTRTGHDWVKVHLMVGTRTNVVTSVEIRGRNAGDSPLFGPLVRTTAKHFDVKEISADKGYLAEENFEIAADVGAEVFIPFKVNSVPDKGGLWEKAFHYFSLNQEEFAKHYHKRSNVETTFSMIKAKFRDHVRARSDTSMKNEVMAKVLCHNVCCLIQSMYELKLEPVFWSKV